MKNYILFFLILLSFGAHSKGKTGLTIRGEIHNAKIPSEIVRLNYNSSVGWGFKSERVVECKIKNNRFQFHIDDIHEIGYIKFVFINSKEDFGLNELLIEPGDDISMKIYNPKYRCVSPNLIFTGKGKEKLNFQNTVVEITEQLVSKLHKRTNNWIDAYNLETLIDDSVKNTCLTLLRSPKLMVSKQVFEILKFDIRCRGPFEFVLSLGMNYKEEKEIDDVDLLNKYRSYISIKSPSDFVSDKSKYYTDFIIWKEIVESRQGMIKPYSKMYVFPKLFNKVTEKYSGITRDKILAFLSGSSIPKDSSQYYRNLTLRIVKNKKYREIILSNKRINGLKFYNFKLEDSHGETVSLSDFKNKVIVLDFYFNGCENCAVLTENIKPVKKEFEKNPNVVFLSINVDKSKIRFLSAVKSGQYTDDKSINLWTNGEGENHKLIKYYQFSGYPQVIILDKKGQILEGLPPLPSNTSDPNILKLIEIINKGIATNI